MVSLRASAITMGTRRMMTAVMAGNKTEKRKNTLAAQKALTGWGITTSDLDPRLRKKATLAISMR